MSNTSESRPPCIRGCTRFGKHVTDCEDRDVCRGCMPRPAIHGNVCDTCHNRLRDLLRAVPVQVGMLNAYAGMSAAPPPRGDADLIRGTGEPKTPIRLACTDGARDISDFLSEVIDELVETHRMRGPKRTIADADRETAGRQKLHYSAMMDGLIWVEPPPMFDAETGSRWLLAQQETFESLGHIGDLFETFSDLMSQGHALAPWREEATRMNGIPCPECKRNTLMVFGGDEAVTCTNYACKASIGPGRYGMWTRMLEEGQVSSA